MCPDKAVITFQGCCESSVRLSPFNHRDKKITRVLVLYPRSAPGLPTFKDAAIPGAKCKVLAEQVVSLNAAAEKATFRLIFLETCGSFNVSFILLF